MATDVEGLQERLARHGQADVLRFWDDLPEAGRARLRRELDGVDLDELDRLVQSLVREAAAQAAIDADAVRPFPVVSLHEQRDERAKVARARGEAALRAGEVAVVVVAGGQGTRLGYDAPKGTFPIGPVSHATLFQIHAEKIAALERRYGCVIPWFVMTSPANHDDTAAFFTRHADFGLERVRLFVQGQMPAVDRASGHLLLSEPDHLALSPDGHGGTLRALAAPGPEGEPSCLDEMRQRGVRSIFYFQVDNALVRVADPLYLGLHLEAHAEVSAKVIEKVDPFEKVGLVVEVDGRPGVIEYSDLPGELAERRRADGRLELSAGSIAIHLFERTFVERIVSGAAALPFHRADKKVPFLDDQGALVEPDSPNAVKFETFIFDTLPLAARVVVVETDRYEFQPLKNASGADSPASVRAAMVELHTSWVEQAGARVRRNAEGTPVPIEISPLYALEAADVVARPPAILDIDQPLYLR